MKQQHVSSMLALLLNLDLIHSFQPHLSKFHLPKNTLILSKSAVVASYGKTHKDLKRLSKKNDQNEEDDDRTGMNDAFKSLDSLSYLDFDDLKDDKKSTTNLKADEQLLKDVSITKDSDDQDEVKFYSEIVQELESEGEDGIYDNIMGEMKESSSSASSSSTKDIVLSDADGIGSVLGQDESEETLTAVEISQNTDEFMKRALEEAMDEVKLKNSDGDGQNAKLPKGILDDAEMIKEINAIFDRANEKILSSVAEMKAEQVRERNILEESSIEYCKMEINDSHFFDPLG